MSNTNSLLTDSNDFARLMDEHLRAGYQCMYITTTEEARVEREIAQIAKSGNNPAAHRNVITWDCYEGFSANLEKNTKDQSRLPTRALEMIVDDNTFSGNNIFIFRDLDDYFADATVRRRIRTLCEQNRLVNKRHKRPLIIVSPRQAIHEKLLGCIYPIQFSLPTEAQLTSVFSFVRGSLETAHRDRATCTPELQDDVIMTMRGLTTSEAENALSRCLVRHAGFKPEMIGTLKDEKASIVKKSEVLTYIPEDGQATREEIGGFDVFLNWLDRRKASYSKKARELHIDYPKGAVLLGVPGTGKSYVAKAAAKLLGLPGYVMDVGAVFGSLVGESEQRMRNALKQIEAQQGCVLLIDEADKAFGGASDSQGDSGVTRRVFGQLLTWLQERRDRTFAIMTLNRTAGIPPEFLRPGRFDGVFYTDLPNPDERRQIFNIHFRKRGVDPTTLFNEAEWSDVIERTHTFVGSEIEAVVVESRYLSFERRQVGDPILAEMHVAIAGIVPMARRDKAGVDAIREYCKDSAVCVTSTTQTGSKRRGRAVSVDND